MAKQKTPVSSAPAKPELDSVAKFEAKLASPPKPKVRLPRLGCFWIFGIFLFFAVGLATGFYHSVCEVPTSFEIPEGRVTVSDPAGMLLEEDELRLESLAKEISQLADCGVALMFIDERFAEPAAVFDQIASEWAPGKGVLLVQDVRGISIRFGLIGEGWRVADWDYDKVWKEAGAFRILERGAKAIALLERLKHSIQTAAKVPVGTEKAGGQSEQSTAQAQAKNPANMTDEELEKQMAAEDLKALEKGIPNLLRHVSNIKNVYRLPCVVAVNRFPTDTDAEIDFVIAKCRELGVNTVLSTVWAEGGKGGEALAREVVRLCEEEKGDFTFSYDLDGTIEDKITAIVTKVYGGSGITVLPAARKEIDRLTALGFDKLPVCVAKTQYSFSDDPTLLGAPENFTVTVKNVKVSAGAGFVVVLTGDIMTMPGLPKVPAAEKIDVDEDGRISGLF